MDRTLDWYEENAEAYARSTFNLKIDYSVFEELIDGNKILDFGCGSGRDSLYFIKQGFDVDALDGSVKISNLARKLTGLPIITKTFDSFDDINKYNGIWACASLLHVSKKDIGKIIKKLIDALQHNGILYMSFKYGLGEGYDSEGRFFNFININGIENLFESEQWFEMKLEKFWFSRDTMCRTYEWLNYIYRKV